MRAKWTGNSLAGLGVALAVLMLTGLAQPALGAEDEKKKSECPHAGQKLNAQQLKTILDKHAVWLKNRGQSSKNKIGSGRALLCKADLQGANLEDANLQGANLEGASLQGANLDGAKLQGVSLEGADLRKARLGGADLQKARLGGADLQKAFLGDANLQGASLRGAKLQAADLRFAKLQGADLENANLQGADLGNAKLQGASLEGADLQKARLDGADLRKARLGGADLQGANLDGADLQRAKLQEAKLQGADLSFAQLQGADLRGAKLQKAHLGRADLQRAKLQEAELQGADLRHAALQDTNLEGANFAGSKLRGASLLGADVKNLAVFASLGEDSFPTGLVSVREKFKIAGEREAERYLTFLIKRNERRQAPPIEDAFGYIVFEATSDWGYAPGRPLKILLGLILIFTLAYLYPIWQSPAHSGVGGIYRIWPKDRLKETGEADHQTELAEKALVDRLHPPKSGGGSIYRIWPRGRLDETGEAGHATELAEKALVDRIFLHLANVVWVCWHAFFFSLLSAFHIGWRDLNVGNWLARLQPREYTLRARGWVRVVSGLQSLISVYLLALSALAFFARPFE